jgi:hypothetical protein
MVLRRQRIGNIFGIFFFFLNFLDPKIVPLLLATCLATAGFLYLIGAVPAEDLAFPGFRLVADHHKSVPFKDLETVPATVTPRLPDTIVSADTKKRQKKSRYPVGPIYDTHCRHRTRCSRYSLH